VKVGFLVWNQFQIGHFAEMIRHFHEPDIIFIDRAKEELSGIDFEWLLPLGAYTRFVRELDLASLDGQYDAILSQFNPPLASRWRKTKLVMTQYSIAKPKTAFNARWLGADLGLVYGQQTADILSPVVPVAQVGNSRFDPVFEGRLDPVVARKLRAGLDPSKPNLLFLPTWGDLSSQALFRDAIGSLKDNFNVIYKPHHVSAGRDDPATLVLEEGTINPGKLARALDLGPHLMDLADVVVSDMSGAIFDGLYCGKPVVLLGNGRDVGDHKKASVHSIEVSRRDEIGLVVTDPEAMLDTAMTALHEHPLRAANEAIVEEVFCQRGQCGPLVAEAVGALVEGQGPDLPPLTQFMLMSDRNTATHPARRIAEKRHVRERLRNPFAFWFDPDAHDRFMRRKLIRKLKTGINDRLWKHHGLILKRQVRRLRRANDFFGIGLLVENWARRPAAQRRYGLEPYSQLQSELRFSRRVTRSALNGLVAWADKAEGSNRSKAARIYRLLGLVDRYMGVKDPTRQTETEAAMEIMGDLSPLFLIGSKNELLDMDDQIVVTPEGAEIRFAEVKGGRVFELPLYRAFSKVSTENNGATRKAMIAVMRELVRVLHQRGWHVLPRIQSGYKLAAPLSGKLPCATWHTIHAGHDRHLHLKVGTLPAYLIIDPEGYSGWSSIADRNLAHLIADVDEVEAEANFARLQTEIVDRGLSKYEQQQVAVPDVGPYIFFPMQVLDDAVAALSHLDSLALLHLMADWGKDKRVKVVVKRHPKCRSPEVARALENYEQVGQIVVSAAAVHDLIRGSLGVVTVNSGVGAEALMHLKPVITTGETDYAAATRAVRTREELEEALEGFGAPFFSDSEIKRFLWFYSRRYQVSADRPEDIAARISDLLETFEQVPLEGASPAAGRNVSTV
jgi:hypothetical protein